MTLNWMSIKTNNYRKSLTALEPDEKFSLHDYDQLEYLLECIEAKGWRSHLCTNERGISTCKIVVGDHEFTSDYSNDELDQLDFDPVAEKESRAEVVLYAYVKALAAQRKIAERSSWQHFKGDRVGVVCNAFCSHKSFIETLDPDDIRDLGFSVLEEQPEKKVELLCLEELCERNRIFTRTWFYASELGIEQGDRVFYGHNGKGFARLKDDFLGVVGPKYPDMEGCLRFLEVSNA